MAKLKEKIGFIGCGNMGGAILQGLLTKKVADPDQIYVFDPDSNKTKSLRKLGVHVCGSNADVVRSSSIILLAIKPQTIKSQSHYDIAKEIKFSKHHIVISILAGVKIRRINSLSWKPKGVNFPIVRAMPNLPAKVGKAITVITGNLQSLQQGKDAIEKAEIIFNACGEVITMNDENYFDLVTAVSGNGPAYFFLLMEILERFARVRGLSESNARKLAIQTAVGSAELARDSQEAPEILRKQVTSKGGTTEAALKVMFKNGIPKIVQGALQKAVKRAKELSKG